MPLRGIAAAVEGYPIICVLPRAPKGQRNTGRGGAQRNPCAQSQPRIQSPEGATENVWHWFDSATHPGQLLVRQCDTPRPTATPLREGMARQRSIDNHCDASAHPLSERGAAKRRGVSHRQAQAIKAPRRYATLQILLWLRVSDTLMTYHILISTLHLRLSVGLLR